MLIQVASNYYSYTPEEDKFRSFAEGPTGETWFTCSEDQVLFLRKAVLSGLVKVVDKLPGLSKRR